MTTKNLEIRILLWLMIVGIVGACFGASYIVHELSTGQNGGLFFWWGCGLLAQDVLVGCLCVIVAIQARDFLRRYK